MQDQRVDLLHTVFAQGCIGPGDVGVVPYLRPQIVLTPNEHPRHSILGHVRFQSTGVETLHHHQHDQGHIQPHIPRQARTAIGVFARPSPVMRHDLAQRLPWQRAFELQQRVVVSHIDLDAFAVGGCSRADPRRTMSAFFHGGLLI